MRWRTSGRTARAELGPLHNTPSDPVRLLGTALTIFSHKEKDALHRLQFMGLKACTSSRLTQSWRCCEAWRGRLLPACHLQWILGVLLLYSVLPQREAGSCLLPCSSYTLLRPLQPASALLRSRYFLWSLSLSSCLFPVTIPTCDLQG